MSLIPFDRPDSVPSPPPTPLSPDHAKGSKSGKKPPTLPPLPPPPSESTEPLTSKSVSLGSAIKSRVTSAVQSFKDVFSRGALRWSPIQMAKVKDAMIWHATKLKGIELDADELKSIDRQIKELQKINSVRKSSLQTVDPAKTKAAWTVRKVTILTVGDINYELQLGRNLKVLLVYKEASETVGAGAYGEVKEVAIDLKTNLGVLRKNAVGLSAATTSGRKKVLQTLKESFQKEVQIPKELHQKAGGYQTGIQRAPYTVTDFAHMDENSLHLLVHRYETTLEPEVLLALSPQKQKQYGLHSKKGPAKMMQGLFTGLRAMHAAGIAHRDIKPPNAAIQIAPNGKPESCLADFGLTARDGNEKQWMATAWYITAQDVALQEKAKSLSPADRLKLQKEQDMYALAITALDILTVLITDNESNAQLLFDAFEDHCHKGKQADIPLRLNQTIQDALQIIEERLGPKISLLLYRMMDPNPAMRPTAAEAEKLWRRAC